MAILITITKGIKVIQVVAANAVLPVKLTPQNSGETRQDSEYPTDEDAS